MRRVIDPNCTMAALPLEPLPSIVIESCAPSMAEGV
jgi:hypothetical protein